MKPPQFVKDIHEPAGTLFDIAAGVVGTMFLALTLWGWCLGEMEVNGERVRYPDPPFLWAIGIGTAIGLGCWIYAGYRYWSLSCDSGGPES